MNKFIDHTLLKPDATDAMIDQLCLQYLQNKFATVCVSPYWAEYIQNYMKDIHVCTVIGFPHGNTSIRSKTHDINICPEMVKEVDIVINVGAVKSESWRMVESEIQSVSSAAQDSNCISKYIVEIGYLTDEELFKIADLLIKYKIDFIKTCTGYGPRNVTVEDIKKIKAYVGDRIKIKASGGITSLSFAQDLISAGADRLGCSSSVSIMKEFNLLS